MIRTRVGYCGGTKPAPTYHALGDHSEAIEILYDPAKISYAQLLAEFWAGHDPRWAGGSRQYRAAVFTVDAEQARQAKASADEIAKKIGAPVQTAIESLTTFTPAEDYHQKYYLRRNRDLVADLAKLAGSEQSFMDSTLAARLNAYYGSDAKADDVEHALADQGLDASIVAKVMTRLRVGPGSSPTCRF